MKDDNILAKWLNNELKGAELEAFMSSPEYATYNKIKEYSAQLTVKETDMDTLYSRIENKRNTPKAKRKNTWVLKIAAVFIFALGAAFFLYTNTTTTALAQNGNRVSFLLPDKSEVTLNAGSEADYKSWNWKNNRKLQLDGEAYFKVAKGQTFDVVTAMGTVTVVGTQFNVKAREERFDVTCFEGKVKVVCNGYSQLITPGESISFENGKLRKMLSEDRSQPSWLSNEVSFNGEKLENVVKELERQYNITIKLDIRNPEKLKRYSSTVPLNDINAALELIKPINHLKSEKAGNTIILSVE